MAGDVKYFLPVGTAGLPAMGKLEPTATQAPESTRAPLSDLRPTIGSGFSGPAFAGGPPLPDLEVRLHMGMERQLQAEGVS